MMLCRNCNKKVVHCSCGDCDAKFTYEGYCTQKCWENSTEYANIMTAYTKFLDTLSDEQLKLYNIVMQDASEIYFYRLDSAYEDFYEKRTIANDAASDKQSQAIKKVFAELKAMPRDQFMKELEKHKNGWFARVWRRAHECECGDPKCILNHETSEEK